MKPSIHCKDNDELADKIRHQVSKFPDPVLHGKMKNALDKFRSNLNFHPAIDAGNNAPYKGRKFKVHKFFIGQIAAAAIVIVPILSFVFLFTESASYAQVNEQFKIVPYLKATLYIKEDFAADPVKIELWVDSGRIRALTESQVIFGHSGTIENAYNINSNHKVSPDDMAADIIRRIGVTQTFSLETLFNCVSLDNTRDLTFTAAPCALAGELTVFENRPAAGDNETIRIWALQKSRLPVQVNIESGLTSVDILLIYSEKQSDAFFDSQTYEEKTAQTVLTPRQRAYLFYNAAAEDKNKK